MVKSSDKRRVLGNIEENIIRGEIVNGVHSYAEFNYGGKYKFRIEADKVINCKRVGSEIYKNGNVVKRSIVSNGRYRNITLGFGDSLMEHQLLAAALIPGAMEAILDLEVDYVINHKTISKASVEARERKHEYDRQMQLYYFEYRDEPDVSLLANPYVPPCDARDLEICTSAENYAHGAFIKTFDLYDISISAKDIDLLKCFMVDKRQVDYTMIMYTQFGAEAMREILPKAD